MPSEAVHVEIDNRVATLAIATGVVSAERRAFELQAALEGLRQDDDVWVVVITGEGEMFFESPTPAHDEQEIVGPQQLAPAIAAIEMPVVTAINGDAIDQGLELALACDIRVASDHVRFGLTQVERGMIPTDGGTQRLPRLIGRSRATEMILTSRVIDAKEALAIGLVNERVSPGEVLTRAQQVTSTIAGHGPVAARYLKEAVLQGLDMTLPQGLRLEADLSFLLQSTADRDEGISSFRERRKPDYRGA